MTGFKIGDKVRRITLDNTIYFKVGDIGVVSDDSNYPGITYVTHDGRQTANFTINLELVKEEKSEMFKEQFVGGIFIASEEGANVVISNYPYITSPSINISIDSQVFTKNDLIELRDLLDKIISIKYKEK